MHIFAHILLYTHCSSLKTLQPGKYCSGQKKQESLGRHSEALSNLGTGSLEGGGIGKGVRKGRSVYKQPGTKVDGSCHI